MSLNANTSAAADDTRVRVILRTADQYHLWRARVNASCWAATRLQVFTITDKECISLLGKFAEDEKADSRHDVIGKCWTLITTSLHDELFLKLVHVIHGHIASLMDEIRSALLVNIAEDVQPLRLELYGASMQRDCNNDLQSFIAFLIQRKDKLAFLKVDIPDGEMVHIFLKGLPSIFQPLQVHFSIPGNKPESFDSIVDTVRKFSATPIVSAELAKLKSAGISQNVFVSASRASNSVNSSSSAPKEKPYCIKFSKLGVCSYGDKCKFYHSSQQRTSVGPTRGQGGGGPPENRSATHSLQECSYCHNKGHTIDVCRKRAARNNLSTPISLSVTSEDKEPATPITAPTTEEPRDPFAGLPSEYDPYCFVALNGGEDGSVKPAGWVFDSGATCCATFDQTDCVDVVPCNIKVTAAGCVFDVLFKGTAVIEALDKKGASKTILINDCLISDKFPFKLLALQTFVKKGYTVLMEGGTIAISNKANDVALWAKVDPTSQLYFLQEEKKARFGVTSLGAQCGGVPNLLLAKSYSAATGGDLLWTLHLRHGHKNFPDVCRQYGLPIPKTIPACSSCVMGKSHVHPHLSSGFTRAKRPAEGFHSDFRGPFSCATPYGQLYLLTLIDDCSRRIFAFLVKSQSEWFDIWTKFVTRVEAEFGRSNVISWLLSDNGAVYRSQIMTAFCSSKGIQQRYSAPYSQWMDHTAERNMRTIGEMMTTTMLHANFPKKAWGFAALHAVDVINRTSESALANKAAGAISNFSRLERWRGVAVPGQTKGLYPFGCLAFKHVPSALRTKLDAHATPVVYLGIDANSRAFLLGSIYDLSVSVSVEVTFFENVFPFRKLKQQESTSSLLWGPDPLAQAIDPRLGAFDNAASDASNFVKLLDRNSVKAPTVAPAVDELTPFVSEPLVISDSSDVKMHVVEEPSEPTPEMTTTEPRRSTRVTIPRVQTNQRYRVPLVKPGSTALALAVDFDLTNSQVDPLDNHCHTILNVITEASLETITPRTAFDALKSPQKASWLLAMGREKDCHLKNGTFDAHTRAPDGVKTIPADWVFKIKHRGGPINVSDLGEKQFKARVVIRGQYMREGLNYNDTFAPVAKPSTLRALLAIATKYNCVLNSGDVETAFLSAKMDCEVWVRMPPYWGPDGGSVSQNNTPLPPRLLLKGVPGIPQGSRLFYETFAARLLALGYKPSLADKCLFINDSLKERNAILIWVDDFVSMHETEAAFARFIFSLRKDFNIPLVGPLVSFLGMTITRNTVQRSMTINQSNSVTVLLERAKMLDCNPVSTPCVTGAVFSKKDCPAVVDSDSTTEFRSLIAMANFISCWSRPDITFTVNKLCKFMANPGELHWKQLKHLLRYLAGTRTVGISYNFGDLNHNSSGLHGYTDSSFADCPDTGRSTLAYVFFYHGALLSWYSKLNSYVTTCTNHSEYNALALGAKEAEWLLLLFSQLDGGIKHDPVPIMVDNSGVVSMVYNPVDHQSNKHVKVGCHYTRELAANKVIIPQRVPSEANIADVFTKPLGVAPFKQLTSNFITTTECILMMTHQDASSDFDEADPEDPFSPVGTSNELFQRRWPYASVLKKYLHAVYYEVNDLGETFTTGRKKFEVSFFGSGLGQARTLISKHDGMQLVSKAGGTYMVCKMTPRDFSTRSPPKQVLTPATPTVTVHLPQPLLTCAECGTASNILVQHISCTTCLSTNFNWSCGCVHLAPDSKCEMTPPTSTVPTSTIATPPAPTATPPASTATPPIKKEPDDDAPKRTPRSKLNQRKWDQQIKYEGRITRGNTYHHMSCTKLCNTTQASIEFAYAYNMKREPCCAAMFEV